MKEASEVTVKGKRGSTREKYYELGITPKDGGEIEQFRISHSVPEDWVSDLIEENVTVLFDPSDNNFVYEANIDGQAPNIKYEQTRDRLISAAKATADSFGGLIFWVISILLIALGVGGVVLHRKLQTPADEESSA